MTYPLCRLVAAPLMLGALLVTASAQAQQQQPQSAPKPEATPTSITLSGCVSRNPGVAGDFTFVEDTSGSEYRLTGKNIRKFAGQKVEIVGGTGRKRLAIRGGLTPTPNIAGQASAIDPAQAAVASRPGGGSTGTGANLPEFRVSQLRAVEGDCK